LEGAEVPHLEIRKNKLVRTALLFGFSIVALLAAAPAAGAATVGYYWHGNVAYYYAAPGEANDVTVTQTTDSYLFSDPNATVTAQYGCVATDAHHATCASKYVNSLYVNTGDGNDKITFQPATVSAFIDCGAGTDSLNTPDPNTKPANCEYINAPAQSPVNPPTLTPPGPLSILQPVTTMTPKGSVPLTVGCDAATGGSCTGTITLELPAKVNDQVAAARRGAPNILGREKITVSRGKKRRVTMSMSARGRSMVKRNKKLKVTAKLKIKQHGKRTTTTQQLTIRAPRHK
jgi:hypothetical protein